VRRLTGSVETSVDTCKTIAVLLEAEDFADGSLAVGKDVGDGQAIGVAVCAVVCPVDFGGGLLIGEVDEKGIPPPPRAFTNSRYCRRCRVFLETPAPYGGTLIAKGDREQSVSTIKAASVVCGVMGADGTALEEPFLRGSARLSPSWPPALAERPPGPAAAGAHWPGAGCAPF